MSAENTQTAEIASEDAPLPTGVEAGMISSDISNRSSSSAKLSSENVPHSLKDCDSNILEKGIPTQPLGGDLQPNQLESRRSSNASASPSSDEISEEASVADVITENKQPNSDGEVLDAQDNQSPKDAGRVASNELLAASSSGPGPLPPSPVALANSVNKTLSPIVTVPSPTSTSSSPSLPSLPTSISAPKIISIDASKKSELAKKARAGGISGPMSVGDNVVSALKGSLTKLSIYNSSASNSSSGIFSSSSNGASSKIAASKAASAKPAPITPLSPELSAQIKQFSIDGFAKKYFGEHRRGFLRRKVPLEKMVVFQKSPLNSPLMVLTKKLHKDALKCFKLIQKIMGDRSGTSSTLASQSSLNNISPSAQPAGSSAKRTGSPLANTVLTDLASSQSSEFAGSTNAGSSDGSWVTKSVIVNTQYLLERGLNRGELRDEIYVQLCKQLTRNPLQASVVRGWKLMSVIALTFPPSKNFEDYLKKFAENHFDNVDPNIQVLAKYAHKKLLAVCKKGPRGKVPSANEIERGLEAAFNPSVFGETLGEVMRIQMKQYPDETLPHILTVLTKAIRDLNGFKTEGIFRVPGDADAVMDLKCQVEKNVYDTSHLNDPNVPASLLKMWMRDLGEPLIPTDLYDRCCKIGMLEPGQERINQAFDLVKQLPDINKRVAIYIIKFLHEIGDPANQPKTKMTTANLAMVFAPNFLRCPSDNPAIILVTTQYEQQFLRTLVENAQLLD